MGQKDIAVRDLTQRAFPAIAGLLLPGRDLVIDRVEEVHLKLLERIPDIIAHVTLDGAPTILHIEFETTYAHAKALPARLMAYNALLRRRFDDRAVLSMIVFLALRGIEFSTTHHH